MSCRGKHLPWLAMLTACLLPPGSLLYACRDLWDASTFQPPTSCCSNHGYHLLIGRSTVSDVLLANLVCLAS